MFGDRHPGMNPGKSVRPVFLHAMVIGDNDFHPLFGEPADFGVFAGTAVDEDNDFGSRLDERFQDRAFEATKKAGAVRRASAEPKPKAAASRTMQFSSQPVDSKKKLDEAMDGAAGIKGCAGDRGACVARGVANVCRARRIYIQRLKYLNA